ncbi:MAG: hypothetical protein WA973_11150 [Mesorhizobium sp.]|jgi:hypothetical protein|uniref:Uncharacterized protein n=1 Tax=Aquamicrobium soli TaxID=1811518 RepID=A0ABV7KEA1_9HYPH
MKDHHDEYIYTRDHRTPQEVWAARREAAFGWLALIVFTAAVFIAADIFLVGCTSLMATTFGWECKAAFGG